MTPSTHAVPTARGWRANGAIQPALFAAVVAVYVLARVLLMPADAEVTGGFSHDSAYISIVADQIRAGHGFVNPAHWLLVLDLKTLPVPFHNANPGYEVAMAALATVLPIGVVRAGFLISALSSALLAAAVFLLVRRYSRVGPLAALSAVAVAAFPANYADSLRLLPDALSTALAVMALAIAVRCRGMRGAALAGVVLGLAWLARSSTLLVLPPLLWWMLRTRGRAAFLKAALLLAAAFALTISPWLIHTWRVWGSPFRSDAAIYLLQDFHSRSFGNNPEYFWRSLETPPSPGQILTRQPAAFLAFYLRGIPNFARRLLATASGSSIPLALCLGLLTVGSFRRWRTWWRTPEFEAGAILLVLTVAMLAVRPFSFEFRYAGPATVLWVIWMLLTVREWLGSRLLVPRVSFALLAALTATLVLKQDAMAMRAAGAGAEQRTVRDTCRQLAASIGGQERVALSSPYFYTWFTGRPAVSPPHAAKSQALRFLATHSVRYLALPARNMDYFYPGAPGSLAPEFRQVGQAGDLILFEVSQ